MGYGSNYQSKAIRQTYMNVLCNDLLAIALSPGLIYTPPPLGYSTPTICLSVQVCCVCMGVLGRRIRNI
jgi:hypothetical protein